MSPCPSPSVLTVEVEPEQDRSSASTGITSTESLPSPKDPTKELLTRPTSVGAGTTMYATEDMIRNNVATPCMLYNANVTQNTNFLKAGIGNQGTNGGNSGLIGNTLTTYAMKTSLWPQ